MCEANAYVVKDGQETLVLESVDVVEPLEEGVYHLVNIFGDQKTIRAKLLRLQLVDHRIVFGEAPDRPDHSSHTALT